MGGPELLACISPEASPVTIITRGARLVLFRFIGV